METHTGPTLWEADSSMGTHTGLRIATRQRIAV